MTQWIEDVKNNRLIAAVTAVRIERKVSIKEAYNIVMDKAKELAGQK